MRAAPSELFCSPVMMLSRMYRAVVSTVLLLTAAVLPRAWATVVKLVPLSDTWMSKSLVLNDELSPPALAWRTVNDEIAVEEPRSTWRNRLAAPEHHLSLLPPDTLPLTAFAGPSLLLHGVEPVAGLFSARLSDGGGGPPPGPSYDGGASFAPLPQELGLA